MRYQLAFAALAASAYAAAVITPAKNSTNTTTTAPVANITCNGKNYIYQNLAGYGYVPYDARDSRQDTIGGMGSSAAIDKSSWQKVGKDKYMGTLWALPDRGFNVIGTINFQPRVHKFKITFDASVKTGTSSNGNVKIDYEESVYFTDPNGTPMTGLDASYTPAGVSASFPGFPPLPVTFYTGDGFGGNGTGGTRVPLDSEGLVLNDDGTFWVSDEYGPYIYKFSQRGKMIEAIRPPNAFIPIRNGNQSFSADSPPAYNTTLHPSPSNPTTGRQNNQGLEGLTISPDGKTLYSLMQSALRQDGGQGGSSNRFYTRFLVYDISRGSPVLKAEYVVRLPVDSTGRVAAQSEIHYVSPTQFFVLARDSGRGTGQSDSMSLYRHADVFDISNATNILGKYDDFNGTIVTSVTAATLKTGITPATYCSFLDYNVNSELNKFGLHNGGAQDMGLLNEKWESFAIVPVDPDSSYDGRKIRRGRRDWGDDDGDDDGDDGWNGDDNDDDGWDGDDDGDDGDWRHGRNGDDDGDDDGQWGHGGHGGDGNGGYGGNEGNGDDYFLFTLSDNDFRGINVYVNSGKTVLHDTVNLENQLLVFKITLPKGSKPLLG